MQHTVTPSQALAPLSGFIRSASQWFNPDRTVRVGDDLYDVTARLTEETNLTRRTLRVILERAGNLGQVFNNPAEYVQRAAEAINRAKRQFLVDGVQYLEVGDAYEMSLFQNLEGYEESLLPTTPMK
jgi:restriction endonuclease